MIYIQNGPAWRPKVLEILNKNLVDGIIWDPREETYEKVNEIKDTNPSLNEIDNIVDNKWFYKQFQNSEIKKLKDLDYIPDEIIDRTFLRDSKKLEEYVIKCFNYQKLYNVSKLLLPTVYLSSFDGRIVDKIFDMCEFAIKYKKENDLSEKVYASIVVQENAFNNMNDVNDFISDLGNYSGDINGIHIVIDRDNGDAIRHNFDSTRLSNIMSFNYTLNNANLDVIYGYCGLESLLLIASGANSISSGWFYSLRKFNRQEKGLEVFQRQGRHIKRYTSIKILHEVKMEEILFQAMPENKEEIFNLIVGDTNLDKDIRNSKNIEEISLNTTYIQYFEALNELLKPMKDLNVEERINYAGDVIEKALNNIDKYNHLVPKPITGITNIHVKNYQLALNEFKKSHYMD